MSSISNTIGNQAQTAPQQSTFVPYEQAMEWSDNWVKHKPDSILPNSALIEIKLIQHFIQHPDMDKVVAFLGLEDVPTGDSLSKNHMRVILHGAKSVGADGDFDLVGSEMSLTLGTCSFDPIPKSKVSSAGQRYMEYTKEGGPIDLDTAIQWTDHWAEYWENKGLRIPNMVIFTKAELEEISFMPRADAIRMLTVYKPVDGAGASFPYEMDFIFFSSLKTPENDFSAVDVFQPGKGGGPDNGCPCPGSSCCPPCDDGDEGKSRGSYYLNQLRSSQPIS